MSPASPEALAQPSTAPALEFSVTAAEPLIPSAVPTLTFAVRIETRPEQPIRSIVLDVQIQIAARGRGYEEREQALLWEVFGTPERWATTLRTLPWLRTTVIVPPFTGASMVQLQVPCSYDLEVTASRYFAALRDGFVPLEFLFSGSVFFTGAGGLLQTTRIALDHDVSFPLPIAAWRGAIDRHFPDSAWLRLERGRFERLCAFKARRALPSWEAAVDALLAQATERDRD